MRAAPYSLSLVPGLVAALVLPLSSLRAQTCGTCEPVAQRGTRVLGCYITPTKPRSTPAADWSPRGLCES